jgi:hypothetical protein
VHHCYYEWHWVCIPSSLGDHLGWQKPEDFWRKPLKCQALPALEKTEELTKSVWSVPDNVCNTEDEKVGL